MKNELDLVVIGSGTAGQGVAEACAGAGWRVALVDPLPFGGTCALRGCDPKRMLMGATEVLDWRARMRGRGLDGELKIDWAALMAFKRTFTDIMPARVEKKLAKNDVRLMHDRAELLDAHTLRVGEEELRTRHVHIATGARPRTIDIPGADLLMSSTSFLELDALPERVVFVGGGYVSFEFAHLARRAGAQVTVLHRGDRPLKQFDPALVGVLLERTRELGVDVRLNAEVVRIEQDAAGLRVTAASDGAEVVIRADAVVHGAGRVPDIDGLGLARAGVEVGPGGVLVNERMQSLSAPHVYAAGDCAQTPGLRLTPVASYEGRIAAKNLLGVDRTLDYPPVPSAVYTIPPLARVGLSEEEARAADLRFDVKHKRTSHWYSSMRVADEHSAFKVLVEHGTGRILGAHVIGHGAEEIINVFTMAMKAGMKANDVKATIFAYPTFSSDLAYML